MKVDNKEKYCHYSAKFNKIQMTECVGLKLLLPSKLPTKYLKTLSVPENPPTAYRRLPMTATPTLARAVVMLGPGVQVFSCGS